MFGPAPPPPPPRSPKPLLPTPAGSECSNSVLFRDFLKRHPRAFWCSKPLSVPARPQPGCLLLFLQRSPGKEMGKKIKTLTAVMSTSQHCDKSHVPLDPPLWCLEFLQ